jgi:DNA-binding PadR family transcriptional regulator
MAATKIQSGSLYPILRRFENAGWVEVREESIDEHVEGRPRRRLYRLTGAGVIEGRKALAGLYSDLGVRSTWLPGFEGAGYQT